MTAGPSRITAVLSPTSSLISTWRQHSPSKITASVQGEVRGTTRIKEHAGLANVPRVAPTVGNANTCGYWRPLDGPTRRNRAKILHSVEPKALAARLKILLPVVDA